uniref:Opticin n=1 Tax=Chelonoidis abingdonii TaxID=106734 RepID=A0A8C0GXI2_CHEAB
MWGICSQEMQLSRSPNTMSNESSMERSFCQHGGEWEGLSLYPCGEEGALEMSEMEMLPSQRGTGQQSLRPFAQRQTHPCLPTCLVCVCLSTSVYCDDAELEQIPPLPLETTYLYARFNRISHIRASDFTRLKKLKRIDLTSNFISWVDEDSFRLLSTLQELILAENRLTALPALPNSIVRLDARLNRIQSSDVRPEAFRELKKLQFLHLSDNNLDYIPVPLPEGLRSLHLQNNNIRTMHKDTFCDSQDHGHIRWALEDIRLDRNPINLSLFSDAYFCLPRLPTGHFY